MMKKSNIKSSAVLLIYFLEGLSFSEKSRAAKKRNQIMYATWWSTYSQGFSASIFPDWGRTYVSDIYHCYIHYFSLLSKERKNLNFNITVIFLPLTIFSLFFALLQRRERFRKQKQDLKRFETHLFITIFLSSREYKGQCSGGDQDEDRESIVYNSYYQVAENSSHPVPHYKQNYQQRL